jgi:uncharacterized small protein (DUF1192 family)
MAAIDEDDRPKKKIAHEIGQDLALLSVEELNDRIMLLNDEVARLQSRLAYYAAPTALAVNMHVYWTGVAADLLRNHRRLVKDVAQTLDFANANNFSRAFRQWFGVPPERMLHAQEHG